MLKQRAAELAREDAGEPGGGAVLHVIGFRFSGELYAVEQRYVREIVPVRMLTPLPGAPGFVLGVVGIRGRIVSLVDLKRFFGFPEQGLSERDRTIVLSGYGMEFGILAEEIAGTQTVPEEKVKKTTRMEERIGARYSLGVVEEGPIVLDAQAMLTDERLVVREG